MQRTFCFGTSVPDQTTGQALVEFARKAEDLGYGELIVGEHTGFGVGGPLVTLTTIAAVTTRAMLTAHVLNNELRHPAILAGELSTLDQVSQGRLIIGLGAGWLREDFDALGVPFDRGAERFARLRAAIELMQQLFRGELVTRDDEPYRVKSLSLQTKTYQQPHPPFFIGGGGQRLVTLAARVAQIIGYNPQSLPGGGLDFATATPDAYDQKLLWVKQAAGERFETLAFHANMLVALVTTERQHAIDSVEQWFAPFREQFLINVPTDPAQLLSSPHVLAGSVDSICEELEARRERHCISRISVPPEEIEAFAPVVARLAGT
jgi:probable F420-dependent oxidoreductase